MATKARLWYPNTSYHITARGNRRNDIFKDDEDFQVYLTMMEEALRYYDNKFKIQCYCLMDNHIHIMIETSQIHYKYYIGRVNSIYAKYFNHKHNYIGHLYQDRYFSEFVETDEQALETSRYIHLNPVKANMTEKPEDYKWSSYSMYIGLINEKLIDASTILSYFGSNFRQQYKLFVESGMKNNNNREESEFGISS